MCVSTHYSNHLSSNVAGTQRKLTSWFGGPTKASAEATTQDDSVYESTIHGGLATSASQSRAHVGALQDSAVASSQQTRQESGSLSKMASPLERPGSGSRASQLSARAGQQPVGAGQRSLKAFFQPPAAKVAAAGAVAFSPALNMVPVTLAGDAIAKMPKPLSVSAASPQAGAVQSSPFKTLTSLPVTTAYTTACLQQSANASGLDGAQSQAAGGASQEAAGVPLSQHSLGVSVSQSVLDVDKAAATEAWQRIHTKMKAPRCKGHSEDCVIREVKKNGPNKGGLPQPLRVCGNFSVTLAGMNSAPVVICSGCLYVCSPKALSTVSESWWPP